MNKNLLRLGVLVIAAFICVIYLSGCNTIKGAGEDLQNLGESGQN